MVSWFYSILSKFTHNGELVLLTITALVYSPLRVSVDARFTQYFVLFLLGFFCSVTNFSLSSLKWKQKQIGVFFKKCSKLR